jgi:hypothetical protein
MSLFSSYVLAPLTGLIIIFTVITPKLATKISVSIMSFKEESS